MTENLADAYRKSIDTLFLRSCEHSKEKLFLALIGIPIPAQFLPPPWDKVKSYASHQHLIVPKLAMEEAYETHKCFDAVIQDPGLNHNKKLKAKLMLMASFYVLEADNWHFILGNALRTIIDESLVGNLFMHSSFADKISGIQALLRKCEKKGIGLDIGDTYSQICNEDVRTLRNAFFHSQYFLSPVGGHLTIIPHIPEIKKKHKDKSEKTSFNFTYIQQMYDRTTVFLKLFLRKTQEITKNFENQQITLNEEVYWIQLERKMKVESYKKLDKIKGIFKYAKQP